MIRVDGPYNCPDGSTLYSMGSVARRYIGVFTSDKVAPGRASNVEVELKSGKTVLVRPMVDIFKSAKGDSYKIKSVSNNYLTRDQLNFILDLIDE